MTESAGSRPPPTLDPRWYEDFFTGLALDLWRGALPPAHSERETDFVADQLALAEGDRVLDVPCGSGRIALRLAARGYEVLGVDLSEASLAEARAALAAAPRSELAARFERRDCRDLPWPGAFKGVTCLGNSFGYFDREGSLAFLTAMARCLRPGGRLLLNSAMAAESLLPNFETRVEIAAGGVRMVAENSYDLRAGRLDTLYRFHAGGREERRRGHHWVFTVAEIESLLCAAGLAVLALYGNAEGGPFALGEAELYLLAEKP